MWSDFCNKDWEILDNSARYSNLDDSLCLELASLSSDYYLPSLRIIRNGRHHTFTAKKPLKNLDKAFDVTKELFQKAIDSELIAQDEIKLNSNHAFEVINGEAHDKAEETTINHPFEHAISTAKIHKSLLDLGYNDFGEFIKDRFGSLQSFNPKNMANEIGLLIQNLGDDFPDFWRWARKEMPKIHNYHTTGVIGDLSNFYEGVLPKFYMWSRRLKLPDIIKKLRVQINEQYGEDLAGLELSNDSKSLFCLFLPDASEEGKFRMTELSETGLIGHTTKNSYKDVLDEAIHSGYRNIANGNIHRLSISTKFIKGNEFLSRMDALKSGDMSWEEFRLINLFESTPAPVNNQGIGSLKLLKSNHSDWDKALKFAKGDVNKAKKTMLDALTNAIDTCISEASNPQNPFSRIESSLGLIDDYLKQGVINYNKEGVDRLRKAFSLTTGNPNISLDTKPGILSNLYGSDEVIAGIDLSRKIDRLEEKMIVANSKEKHVLNAKINKAQNTIGLLNDGMRLVDTNELLANRPKTSPLDQIQFELLPPPVLLDSLSLKDKFSTNVVNIPTKQIKTAFTKIDSIQKAAHLGAHYRKSAQEVFVAILTDENNEVLQLIEHTKGGVSSAHIHLPIFMGSMFDVKKASNVWLLHNHPGGGRDPSIHDYSITEKVKSALEGTSLIYRGHAIVTGGRNATSILDYDSDKIKIPAGVRNYNVPVTERLIRGRGFINNTPIQNAKVAISVIKKIKLKNAAILLDIALKPVGIIDLNGGELDKLKGTGGVERILSAIHKTNAESVFIKLTDCSMDEISKVKNLTSFLSSFEIRTTDWMQSYDNGKTYISIRETKSKDDISARLKGNGQYKKIAPENSPGSKLDKVKGWVRKVENDTGVNIQVVADETMLPVRIQNSLKGPVSGLYDLSTKTPYVIASQIDNEEHAIKVALHEGIGHFGCLNFLERNAEYGGKSVEYVLDKIYEDVGPRAILKVAKGYEFDLSNIEGRRESVLEYIAHIAEEHPNYKSVVQFTSSTHSLLDNMYGEIRWSFDDVIELIESSRNFTLMENVTRAGSYAMSFEERAVSRRKAYSDTLANMGERLRSSIVNPSLGVVRIVGGEYFNGFASSLIINDSLHNKGIDGFQIPHEQMLNNKLTLDLNLPIKYQTRDLHKKLEVAGIYNDLNANEYEIIIKELGKQEIPKNQLENYLSISTDASLNFSIANMSGLEFYGYLEENIKHNPAFPASFDNADHINTPADLLRDIGIQGISIKSLEGESPGYQYLTFTNDLAESGVKSDVRYPKLNQFNDLLRSFEEDQLSNAPALVKTKEFKGWIKNSVTVDKNGTPAKFYHHTDNGFDSSSKGPIKVSSLMEGESSINRPIPVYIKAESPFYIQDGEEIAGGYDSLKSQGYDSVYKKTEMGDEWVVFNADQVKLAVNSPGSLLSDLPNILEKKVFHGSPHKFDRFNLRSIGSGEGAQAYGWGIYLAGNKEVAEFYQKTLAAGKSLGVPKSRYINETPSSKEFEAVRAAANAFNRVLKAYSSENFSSRSIYWGSYYQFYNASNSIGTKDREYYEHNKEEIEAKIDNFRVKLLSYDPLLTEDEVQEKLEFLGFLDTRTPFAYAYKAAVKEIESYGDAGYLYEVEIPTENNLLDWDIPLSEMPKSLTGKLEAVISYLKTKPLKDSVLKKLENGGLTGEEIYRYLSAELSLDHNVNVFPEGKELASIALEGEGIPGLRYWDGNTRGSVDKEKEYNYVIWDMSAIETIKNATKENAHKNKTSIVKEAVIKKDLLNNSAFLTVADSLGVNLDGYEVVDQLEELTAPSAINCGPTAVIVNSKVEILKNSVKNQSDIEKLLLGTSVKESDSAIFESSNKQAYSKFWLEMGQLEGLKSCSIKSGLTLMPYIDHTKIMMNKGKITPDQRMAIVIDEYIAQAILGENYPNLKESEKSLIKEHVNNMRGVFGEFNLVELKAAQSSEIIHLMKQANLSRVAINNGQRPELIIPAASGILYYKWQKAIEAELISQHGAGEKDILILIDDMRSSLRTAFVDSKNPSDFVSSPETQLEVDRMIRNKESKITASELRL